MVAMGDLYYYGAHGLPRDQAQALSWFQRAAAAPHHAESAQVACGNMYLKGEGTEKNRTKAMAWYTKAADQHNSTRALNGLAYLYFHGDPESGLAENKTRAYELFSRAAGVANTNGDSLFNAGHCLWEGLGVARDRAKAVSLFTRAAEEFGHFGSIHKLGAAHLSGVGVEQRSCQTALKYLVPAAKHGSWGNVVRRGFNRYMAGDMGGAAVRYIEGGEMGYHVAHTNVAYLLDSGRLSDRTARDTFAAVALPQPTAAAAAGEQMLVTDAAKGLQSGQDGATYMRRRMALHFYNLARDEGSTSSDLRLGDFHYYGYGGLPRDLNKAAHFYRLASAAGVAEAAYSLATMYSDGELSASGRQRSAHHNRQAGESGEDTADFPLAKRLPGPAEEALAEKYFRRCQELDPSDEVQAVVTLAMAKIAARRYVSTWQERWREVWTADGAAIENFAVSASVLVFVLVTTCIVARQRVAAATAAALPPQVVAVVGDRSPPVLAPTMTAAAPSTTTTTMGPAATTELEAQHQRSTEPTLSVTAEDDAAIASMIREHLRHVRHRQAVMRAAMAAGLGPADPTGRSPVPRGRRFLEDPAQRAAAFAEHKIRFQAAAFRKYCSLGTPAASTFPGKLVLVCGPSGCGKSTLAMALAERLDPSIVVRQDDHFTQPFLPYEDRSDDSFEGPVHIDWPKIRAEVEARLRFSAGVVILEGHMVATDTAGLRGLASAAVVLEGSRALCRARRLGRRKRSIEDRAILSKYIDEVVWPAHLRYSVPAQNRLAEELGGAKVYRVPGDDTRTAAQLANDAKDALKLMD